MSDLLNNSKPRPRKWTWRILVFTILFAIAAVIVRLLLPSIFTYFKSELTRRYGLEVLDLDGYKMSSTDLSFDHGKFVYTKPVFTADISADGFAASFDRQSISERRINAVRIEQVDSKINFNATFGKTQSDVQSAPIGIPIHDLSVKQFNLTLSGLPNVAGDLKLSFALEIQRNPSSALTAKISRLSGGIENQIAFADARADLEVDLSNGLNIKNLKLMAGKLDAGVKLSKLISRLSYANSRLKIVDASADILGGRVSFAPTEIDLTASSQKEVVLGIKEIEIAEILKLYPNERLEGQGKINANIPLTIAKSGYSIKLGTFFSEGEGRLKVSFADNMNSGALDIAKQALQNLHFDKLSGNVDLAEDGALVLSLQISGRNPEMNNGQPLNVNLKVEENLKALLKTLKIADNVEDAFRR